MGRINVTFTIFGEPCASEEMLLGTCLPHRGRFQSHLSLGWREPERKEKDLRMRNLLKLH